MAVVPLKWLDWLIFAATLIISLGIGLYYAMTGDRQKTTKEYLMGNRQLKVIPVSMSLFMTYISAVFILGTTAEMYTNGVQYIVQTIGTVLGLFITSIILAPVFYPLKLTSSFEYVEMRFRSRPLRLLCVLTLILNQIFSMGLAMYAPATALEGVTGFPVWASTLIASFVTMIYTCMGGMKAVVWTDVFQGFVMFGGLIAVFIIGAVRVGGMAEVWETAKAGDRLNFFDFSIDPTMRMNFWPLILGETVMTIASLGTNQVSVQRYCALPSVGKAKLCLLLGALYFAIFAVIVGCFGIVMYAYFAKLQCDPLRGRLIDNSNQLLPYFVVDVLNIPGLPGLFLAVLFSGALSTLSSSMNSLSAVTWKDILEPKFKTQKEEYKALITKILVLIYGLLAMGMSFLMAILPGHVREISSRVLGAIQGPVNGVMLLGTMFPFTNAIGSIAGSIVSVGITLWMTIGAYIFVPHQFNLPTDVSNCTFGVNETALPVPTDPPHEDIFWLYRISFTWVPFFATAIVVIVGILVSLFTGRYDLSKIQPPGLVSPISNYLCCCCPKSVRRFFWCGVDHDKPVESEDKRDSKAEGDLMGLHEQPARLRKGRKDSQDAETWNHSDPTPISYIKIDRL